nr:immunoglobulin heavy chain junction region [Macaca mulatta]MOW98543.1 immunoglobulin heavy chain junction region [Macaca mulatta]MOW99204.1 immunoglobulin heavy chain junction region [Macaca mulatta]MOW99356.1 immunoglobulin heavy chain junction region [Macaca mulatta]MOX00588.1 immunoglobulin heavy chain junction region [Macaca mulatta]
CARAIYFEDDHGSYYTGIRFDVW